MTGRGRRDRAPTSNEDATVTQDAPETPPKGFEEALAELEGIVTQLERGDLPLETALATFEAGIALVRRLTQALSAAEARIDVLTRASDGTLRLDPLPGSSDPEA